MLIDKCKVDMSIEGKLIMRFLNASSDAKLGAVGAREARYLCPIGPSSTSES